MARGSRALLHHVLDLGFIVGHRAFELGDGQFDVGALQLGQRLAGGDALARLHGDRDQFARHVDPNGIGVAGLEPKRANHAVRQRQKEECQQQGRQKPQAGVKMRLFHLFDPPGHVEKLAGLIERHAEQPIQRRGDDQLADKLHVPRQEQLIEKPADRERHDPSVDDRGDRVDHEKNLVPLGQEGVLRRLHPQAPLAQLAAGDRGGLLPQVGNLGHVGKDVVAVVAQQRIGVENHRGDRADEHHVQAEHVQQAGLREPPEEGADRGQHQLDVHAGRPDVRPLPLVRQQPGVGHVAIQARGQHQDHDAHFVAFAAEVLAGQSVAELVHDLRARPTPPSAGRRCGR